MEVRNMTNIKSVQKKDLIVTHVLDAPVTRVWKACTEPELVKRWWGPKGFTSPVCKINFRVGDE